MRLYLSVSLSLACCLLHVRLSGSLPKLVCVLSFIDSKLPSLRPGDAAAPRQATISSKPEVAAASDLKDQKMGDGDDEDQEDDAIIEAANAAMLEDDEAMEEAKETVQ